MNILKNLDFIKAIKDLLPQLLGRALFIVLAATLLGFAPGLLIGFILALARISKNKVLNRIVILFQELIAERRFLYSLYTSITLFRF